MLLIWLCACELAPSETPVGSSVLEQPGPLELAEALYAIDQPSPQAQRVSMLLWLRSMELSPEQLSALRSASVRVRNALAQRDAELEVIAGAQAEAQAEALAQLEQALVAGEEPPEVSLLREDPRPVQAAYVLLALEEAEVVVEGLGADQRPAMANALFLLRPRFSVEDYEGLLGRPWAPGDFATMKRASSGEQDPLDPGGIFTLEAGEHRLTEDIDHERLVVLVALALENSQLVPALDLLLAP